MLSPGPHHDRRRHRRGRASSVHRCRDDRRHTPDPPLRHRGRRASPLPDAVDVGRRVRGRPDDGGRDLGVAGPTHRRRSVHRHRPDPRHPDRGLLCLHRTTRDRLRGRSGLLPRRGGDHVRRETPLLAGSIARRRRTRTGATPPTPLLPGNFRRSRTATATPRRPSSAGPPSRWQGGGDFTVFDELFADDYVDNTRSGTHPRQVRHEMLYQSMRAAFQDFHARSTGSRSTVTW